MTVREVTYRFSRVWMSRLAVALIIGATPVFAQMTPRELFASYRHKMAKGDFESAVFDIQQLIEFFGENRDADIVSSMEPVFFSLGICHFFAGNFAEADKAFKDFIRRYPRSVRCAQASMIIGDSLRFQSQFDPAIKQYRDSMSRYRYSSDELADMHSAIARCLLAQDKWTEAKEPLLATYELASDFLRSNWAATLLVTAFLKDLELERVYELTPLILRPNSFASRSIVFNLAALEAGDQLFGMERYREALWILRLVYPFDHVLVNSEAFLLQLQQQASRLMEHGDDPRELMRVQERIGELENEIELINSIENYDVDLMYRIARGYMELMRYYEGREIFLHLHDIGGREIAEEALYLAFLCSAQLMPWERAYEIGRRYMDTYSGGEYYDGITLLMAQMYAREKNWNQLIAHLEEALRVSPEHESGAECRLLLGYACFMEERFADTIRWLTELRTKYPGTDLMDEVIYWLGMAHLFLGEYASSSNLFDEFLNRFPESPFIEDAMFRRATCAYGLSEFRDADERLLAFLGRFPESKLEPEALVMRADIAGAEGRALEAVPIYRQAMEAKDLNIELYNHSAFQAGTILFDEKDYEALRELFMAYIRENREGSNLPMAVYWVGRALWNKGEKEGALRYYREAVELYGHARDAIGIDMILDEWIARIRQSEPEIAKQAWAELIQTAERARSLEQKTLELRMNRVLLYNPDILPSERQAIVDSMLSLPSITHASPAVLRAALDLARTQNMAERASDIARFIIQEFAETDYALDARMMLATDAIRRGKAVPGRTQKRAHYEEAIIHLDIVRTVFGENADAGAALLMLADIYMELDDYKKADEYYQQVLSVRGWRPMWPEALYGRGEAAVAQGDPLQAAAFYERIYLMYGHYTSWAAKAYVKRAEMLRRIGEIGKAREVLDEMLQNSALTALPEAEEARNLQRQLGGGR